MPRRAKKSHVSLAAAGVLLLSACASTPPPNTELAAAESALAEARAAGAADFAPVEFGFAQSKLDSARSAIEARKYADAQSAARQAEVDAELALAKSQAAKLRREVAERSDANARLRRELLGEDSP